MSHPADLKYTKDHEWIRLAGEIAEIGITDFAQDQLGDVVFVELPDPGRTVTAGESFGTIESVKAVSDVIAPLSGEILEVNQKAVDAPETVNEDPYGEGWLIRIRLSDSSEVDGLLDVEAYKQFLSEQ